MSAPRPSRKPYLLRALHEWMGDAGLTPQVIVDATVAGVDVPPEHVQEGKIVLNIGMSAVRDLQLRNDAIACTVRFGGAARELWLPMPAVLGIYARETGEGVAFAEEEQPDPPTPPEGGGDDSDSRRSHLKVVK